MSIAEVQKNAPAFPCEVTLFMDDGSKLKVLGDGLTAQQYAAIHLKVPKSGTDWLDEMITESLRNDFAGQALQAIIIGNKAHECVMGAGAAKDAYGCSDAMIKLGKS